MGHKVNPVAFRLGIQKGWKSRWFNKKQYAAFLEEDFLLRKWLLSKLDKASVESIDIVRSGNSILVTIKSARPGLIIGRGGKGLEELQQGLRLVIAKRYARHEVKPRYTVKLEIEEIRKPETYARLVAKNVASELERRIPFRRVLKQAIEKVSMQPSVKGVKICVSGRLGGTDIARTEHLAKGRMPLQNLRADIDYASLPAKTTYGAIGVKVWIYKGDVFADTQNQK